MKFFVVEEEHVDQPPSSEPQHSNKERRGVPPLRFVEKYLAAGVEKVKQIPPVSSRGHGRISQ